MVLVVIGHPLLLELGGCQVAERLMRPLLIVLTPVLLGKQAGLRHVSKERALSELVAQPPMKALAKAILPGTARLDVGDLDVLLRKPGAQEGGDELWTVVTAEDRGRAMLGKERGQHGFHRRSREARCHGNDQALAREVVAHAQEPQLSASFGAVQQEVQRPDVVWAERRQLTDVPTGQSFGAVGRPLSGLFSPSGRTD